MIQFRVMTENDVTLAEGEAREDGKPTSVPILETGQPYWLEREGVRDRYPLPFPEYQLVKGNQFWAAWPA